MEQFSWAAVGVGLLLVFTIESLAQYTCCGDIERAFEPQEVTTYPHESLIKHCPPPGRPITPIELWRAADWFRRYPAQDFLPGAPLTSPLLLVRIQSSQFINTEACAYTFGDWEEV